MTLITAAFVLALVVPCVVLLALCLARLRDCQTDVEDLIDRLQVCEAGLRQTSGAQLAAEVAALDAAVAELTATQKQTFAKLWGRIGTLTPREKPHPDFVDDELARKTPNRDELRRDLLPLPTGLDRNGAK